MKTEKSKIFFSIALILIAIASRLLPHEWNFTAINAVVLFSTVFLGYRYSIFIAIFSMLLSDLFLGFYSLPIMLSVYLSLITSVFIGKYVGSKIEKNKIMRPIVLAFISSVLFYLVTNAAVWFFSGMYSKDLFGLMNSYYMAIPFFKNSLLGDLWFTTSFFYSYELVFQKTSAFSLKTKKVL